MASFYTCFLLLLHPSIHDPYTTDRRRRRSQHGRLPSWRAARFVQTCITPAALDKDLSRRDNPHKLSNCYFGGASGKLCLRAHHRPLHIGHRVGPLRPGALAALLAASTLACARNGVGWPNRAALPMPQMPIHAHPHSDERAAFLLWF